MQPRNIKAKRKSPTARKKRYPLTSIQLTRFIMDNIKPTPQCITAVQFVDEQGITWF